MERPTTGHLLPKAKINDLPLCLQTNKGCTPLSTLLGVAPRTPKGRRHASFRGHLQPEEAPQAWGAGRSPHPGKRALSVVAHSREEGSAQNRGLCTVRSTRAPLSSRQKAGGHLLPLAGEEGGWEGSQRGPPNSPHTSAQAFLPAGPTDSADTCKGRYKYPRDTLNAAP